MRTTRLTAAAVVVGLLTQVILYAQVYQQPQLNQLPPVGGGYGGYGGYGGGGMFGRTGGALYGSASVMNSYGNVVVQQEQARVQREVANQAKIDTKRKAFDEMMYEKANTPSFTEEQEKIQAMTLRRIMNQPTPTEVTTGKAQNMLLPYLHGMIATGIQGPPVTLDPSLVSQINVSTQQTKGSLGPLRQGGHVEWPLLLKGKSQQKIDGLLPTAVSAATMGTLDAKLYRELTKELQSLSEQWRKQFHKEEIDGAEYLDGKHFLDSLQEAVTALSRPGAAKVLDGSYAARGRTVPELVENMTGQGLTFAPATLGHEAAYYALQNAMVAYARGSQTDTAFQNRMAPPMPQNSASYKR
jgi:hypothetical protein